MLMLTEKILRTMNIFIFFILFLCLCDSLNHHFSIIIVCNTIKSKFNSFRKLFRFAKK
jgi:hypothetical protein